MNKVPFLLAFIPFNNYHPIMKTILTSILIACGGLTQVHAQGTTNAEIVETVAKARDAADRELNAAYQKLMAVLPAEGKAELKTAQKAWLAYRDAQSMFDSHHFGQGKFRNIERIGSVTQLTKARTKQLLQSHKNFQEIYGR